MGTRILIVWTRREGETAEKKRISFFSDILERSGFEVMSIAIKPIGKASQVLGIGIGKRANHIIERIGGKNIDLVIASIPAVLNALVGYSISKELNVPLILDVRDVWEEYAKTRYRHIYMVGVTLIVKRYYKALRAAKLITVPTDLMANYYSKKLSLNNVQVVPNGTWLSILRCRDKYTKEYDLIYLADFNNPYQEFKLFVELLYVKNIRLAVLGGGKYLGLFKDYARERGVLDKIRFLGRIPYTELPKYLCRGRIGVIGRPFIDNPAYLYSIPTKTYDYMAAGLPILAYGPKGSALEDLINRLGIGRYLSEYNVSRIVEYYEDITSNYRYYSSNSLRASTLYDKENIGRKLITLVKEALGS